MAISTPCRRREQRVRIAGNVRLLVDSPGGLVTVTGQIIDLSELGCALRLCRRVDPEQAGRAHLEIARTSLWIPVITVWSREEAHDWIVGCEFDRPTVDKLLTIRGLVLERHRLSA